MYGCDCPPGHKGAPPVCTLEWQEESASITDLDVWNVSRRHTVTKASSDYRRKSDESLNQPARLRWLFWVGWLLRVPLPQRATRGTDIAKVAGAAGAGGSVETLEDDRTCCGWVMRQDLGATASLCL